MVCQGPKRLGNPRHLHPCSATKRSALRNCRLVTFTLPRCRGNPESVRRNCVSVSSTYSQYHKNQLVLTRPRAVPEKIYPANDPSDDVMLRELSPSVSGFSN